VDEKEQGFFANGSMVFSSSLEVALEGFYTFSFFAFLWLVACSSPA
jgi:hypothetical protein